MIDYRAIIEKLKGVEKFRQVELELELELPLDPVPADAKPVVESNRGVCIIPLNGD